MKIPSGMVDLKGNAFKGFVYLSSSSNNEGELQEFGIERDSNTISCFVLTAPGDVIELGYALSAGTCDFFDVVVDGVRRYSTANDKDVFRGSVKRVLYSARGKGQRRGGVKNSLMQVKARDFDNEADEDDEPISSVVGSIIFEAFQKSTSDDEPEGDDEADTSGDCDRYPEFEKCATWEETTDHNGIRDGEPTTSMEIDLIDGTKTPKLYKEKVLRSYSAEYKQVAKFIFKLRSTSDLEAMGQFEDVPEYEAPEYVTLEQRRALKAAAASSDTQAAVGEDDEEEDEDSAKSKTKSTAGSAKKAASKTPKGKGGKTDVKTKSNAKKTKVEEDAEGEDDKEENDEPTPTVPKNAARTTSKAKAPKKNGKATSPEKSISEVSATGTDMSVDENNANEDTTVKNEEDVPVQPSIHEGSEQNGVPSTDDFTQYMEAQDDENEEDVLKSSSDGITATPVLPLAEYSQEYPNLSSEDFEVAQVLVGMSAPALPDEHNTIEYLGLDVEDAEAPLILVAAPVQDATLGSTAREELMEVAEGFEIVQEPKGQDTILTPLKKKPLTLQGSPEAPAYHAWLDRDKELERLRLLLGADVGEATMPVEELREGAALPFEPITSPSVNVADLQIRKSKLNMDKYGKIAGAEGADDYDFDSDDLDAPLRTTTKPMRMMAVKQSRDLSHLDTEPEGQDADAIDLGKDTKALIDPVSEKDVDDNASQLTDVAPIDDVLSSVADSKRIQTIPAGISIDLGAAYEEEQALRKVAAGIAHQQIEDTATSELDLAGQLDVHADSIEIISTGNRVPARSASPGVSTKPRSTLQGPVQSRASSAPAKGELISQSQISTQSHDSKYNVTSSPVVKNAKAVTLGESPASGQKGTKEDIDDILLPKKKKSVGAGDTKSTSAHPKTTAKRKLDNMADTSPESPDPKKPSPAAKTGKPAGKRVSISDTPTEVVAETRTKTVTPSKKASEKRKSVEPKAETTTTTTRKSPAAKAAAKANVNEKRKAASMSDTKADTDTPRKSASIPANRKTSAMEKELMAAKARVEAAEKKKRELEEEYQAALLVKQEREKAKHMIEKAEEIERENAELQARIAAIYNTSTD